MRRGRLAFLWILRSEIGHIYATLGRQKLGRARALALVVFFVGLLFFFLASTPILSPFIYPLF